MAVATFAFSSTEFSIFNNIYYKIIEDVAKVVDLDPKALHILYKDIDQSKTDLDTNVSTKTEENRPKTVSKKRVRVNVNQEYDEDDINTTAIHRDEHIPIFYDGLTNVVITPIYIQMNAELEFTYTSPSKTEVARIRDMIRIHLSNTRNIGSHEVEYSMIVPDDVITFIEDVYDLRNRLIPEDIADYFKTHSTNRMHLLTDMSNEGNAKFAIREKQVRIIGHFEFSPTPEKADRNTTENTTSFSFSYRFSVNIPRGISVRYPLMICNKMLPEKYWSHLEEKAQANLIKRNTQEAYIGFSMQNLSRFESNRQLENNMNLNLPVKLPACDDFISKQGHKGYGIAISMLIEVDEDDKRTLFNLRDLDNYHLNSRVIEYISSRGRERITYPYLSHLYIGLHQDNKHYDNSILEIDENLEVRSKVELSLISPVRVTISICIDLSYLQDDTVHELVSDSLTFLDFLKDHMEARSNYREYITDHNRAIRYLNETLAGFINIRANEDDYSSIEHMFEIISNYDSLFTHNFISMLVKEKPNYYNLLVNNGIKFTSSGGMLSYSPKGYEGVVMDGSSDIPFSLNDFGSLRYPGLDYGDR